MTDERAELDLVQAMQMLLDECRMILPGIQAIFGFQLIAVFQQRFVEELERPEQLLHLLALLLVAIAAALIMTPAAYHRTRGARHVTGAFIEFSGRLVLVSLVALASGLALDVYVVARLILGDSGFTLPVAAGLFAAMAFLWFLLPHFGRRPPSARPAPPLTA